MNYLIKKGKFKHSSRRDKNPKLIMNTKLTLCFATLLFLGWSSTSCNRTPQGSCSEHHAKTLPQDEIICYCSNVSKADILEAIEKGAKTLQDIREMTTACTIGRCEEFNPKKSCCAPDILQILREHVEVEEETKSQTRK